MANKEEVLETSSETCLKKTKIILCFHDNSQHQQSRAKPKWKRTQKEHLTDRQQESGLKLNTARGMFCPLLLVSSVFVICSLFSVLIVRKEGKKIYGST